MFVYLLVLSQTICRLKQEELEIDDFGSDRRLTWDLKKTACFSAVFRRQMFNPFHMGLDVISGEFVVDATGRWRVIFETQLEVLSPGFGRPHRPLLETAPAFGADISKNCFNAICAIGTFIGTDHGIRGLWSQILVTKLTIRAQFKHGVSPLGSVSDCRSFPFGVNYIEHTFQANHQ